MRLVALRMRMATALVLTLGPILTATAAFAADDYPARAIRIIVTSVPGSTPDVLARLLGERLAPALKQPVVIENRAGAGGVIGVDSVAKAAPDGYTLVIAHDGTMAVATVIHAKLPYDPMRDFAPVAMLGYNELVLIAHPRTGSRNIATFIDDVRSKDGKAIYGSAGVGTPNHLFMEQLLSTMGVAMVHVPYKGGAAAVADLIAGQLDYMIAGIAPAQPHIRSGKAIAIAVPQPTRASALPNVPTVAESVPGFAPRTWFGLFAPAAVPPFVVSRLNEALARVLADPELREKLAQQGVVVEPGSPGVLASQVQSDIARYAELAKRIKLDIN